MPVGGVHFAKRRGDDLDLRILLDYVVDHAEERARIELRFGGDLRTGDAESLLQVLFVADQHVDVLDDAADHRQRAFLAAPDVPELLAR